MKQSKFQFLSPYLEELNFSVNPDYDASDDEIEMHNSFSVQISRYEQESRANVALTLESNLEDEKAPFRLRIKVASDFKWEDLSEEKVQTMLELNAPALLLSYMRPIVANITNSSKLPAYNLPFINFKE